MHTKNTGELYSHASTFSIVFIDEHGVCGKTVFRYYYAYLFVLYIVSTDEGDEVICI